ncbi:MAG TPA: DUF481 domain-containing protein [Tepidisphaeraceae bacterium]|nr:DUF481 domain-containing protein [Tepidisphaeraceae bacterium]
MYRCCFFVGFLACLCPLAFAGEVTFKNGDHLSGTVTAVDDNKLQIDSKMVGKVTVSLSDVSSFTTDLPVKATLKNGTIVDAAVSTNSTSTTAPSVVRAIPRDQIAKIEPASLAQPWKGDVLVGATVQSGNTRASQVNFSADAVRRWESSRLTLKGQYIFGRQYNRATNTKSTTSDYGEFSSQYDYFISKKLYAYGLFKAQHDGVADLQIRLEPSAGLGYQWHESPIWKFSTEAGLGWTYEDYSPGGVDEYTTARVAYHYNRKLTPGLAFVHDLEILPSVQDISQFVANADAGLRADFTKQMFSEFKVEWTYNSKPAPDACNNDLRYIASFGWHF